MNNFTAKLYDTAGFTKISFVLYPLFCKISDSSPKYFLCVNTSDGFCLRGTWCSPLRFTVTLPPSASAPLYLPLKKILLEVVCTLDTSRVISYRESKYCSPRRIGRAPLLLFPPFQCTVPYSNKNSLLLQLLCKCCFKKNASSSSSSSCSSAIITNRKYITLGI